MNSALVQLAGLAGALAARCSLWSQAGASPRGAPSTPNWSSGRSVTGPKLSAPRGKGNKPIFSKTPLLHTEGAMCFLKHKDLAFLGCNEVQKKVLLLRSFPQEDSPVLCASYTKHTLGFETFLIKFSSYNSHTSAPFRFASEQLPGQEKEPTTSGNQRSPGKEPREGRPPASCPPGGGRATTSTHPHPTSLLHGHRRRRAVNHLQNERQHQKQCRASRSIWLY